MTRIAPAPIGAATAVAAGLVVVTQGALVVAGLWLFVGVFVMIGLQEVVGEVRDLDVAARATITGLALLVVGGGLAEAVRLAVERGLRMRTARRLAAAGAPMPPAVERAQLLRSSLTPVRTALGVGAAVGALLGLLLAVGGAIEQDEVLAPIGVAVLVATAAAIALVMLLGRLAPRHDAAVDELEAVWPDLHERDEPRGLLRAREAARARLPRGVRRRRRRVDVLLGRAIVTSFVVLLAGLLLRQQCRRCEPLAYDPFGESVVDGVAAVGLLLTALTLVLAVVRGVWWIAEQVVGEVRTLADADAGRVRRSEWLDRVLVEPRSLELVARVVGVVAMSLAMGWAASQTSADLMDEPESALAVVRPWAVLGPWALVTAVLAAVLGIAGVVVARAWRARAWPHVDHDPYPHPIGGGS